MASNPHALLAVKAMLNGSRPPADEIGHSASRLLSAQPVKKSQLAVVELPLLLLLIMIVAISAVLRPDTVIRTTEIDLPVAFLCPFYLLTDIPCLFCGLTRSFLAMGGLDIAAAFRFHPLGPPLYLAMIAISGVLAWSLMAKRRLRLDLSERLRNDFALLACLLIVGAWFVKIVVWKETGLL